jgi:hypothetical protein
VRAAAKDESVLAAEAMRAALAEANAEMSRLFGDAKSNFETAAGEIRGLSKKIHREIQATSAEVRRGAEELPRETAEQAAALRRVVGDQVKALNELTGIVTRSGRNHDIAEPTPAPAAPRAFDPPPARPQPPRARPAAPPPAPPQAAAQAPVSKPSPVYTRPSAAPDGGWLSSLRDRAGRDAPLPPKAPEPAPPAPVSGLATLSLDIAGMVDDQAVADVWRRYQRGEKGGLFGRRLYTAQGRQTFEEISRRYRIDPEFHATIDQYIRNFEELLVETSRGDLDGGRTLELLTGDTGKVYTMLGHATGRLD